MLMASDSAVSSSDQITIMRDPKFHLFKSKNNSDMLVGFAGRLKAGQVIASMQYEEIPKDQNSDPKTFISQVIAPIFQNILHKNLLTVEQKGEEISASSCFLIAYRGRIFKIGLDFCVSESADGFNSIGSGQSFALAAMSTAIKILPDISPEKLILFGMSAAEKYSTGVRRPFKMTTIDNSPKKESRKKTKS